MGVDDPFAILCNSLGLLTLVSHWDVDRTCFDRQETKAISFLVESVIPCVGFSLSHIESFERTETDCEMPNSPISLISLVLTNWHGL